MKLLNFITTNATLSMPVSTYESLLQKMVTDERKRIIKLLEDFLNSDDLEPEAADGIWQVLPLIKAEVSE